MEIKIRPATDTKGTEIMARPLDPVPSGVAQVVARVRGDDPRQEVRRALREAKSLLETGEVVCPTTPGSDRPTFPGRLLDLVTSRAGGEGWL